MTLHLTRTLLITFLLLLAARTGQAIEMVHVINMSFKITFEGPASQKGDTITLPPTSLRADVRSFISSIALLRGQATYPTRAQLLLLRHNVGEEEESANLVIRLPGGVDWPVDEYLSFGGHEGVLSGQINPVTGRERSSLTYIGRFSLYVPNDIGFDLAGVTVEKRSSIRINNQEIDAGLSSSSARLAGEGTGMVEDFTPLVIVEGTLTVGAGKVVPTP